MKDDELMFMWEDTYKVDQKGRNKEGWNGQGKRGETFGKRG